MTSRSIIATVLILLASPVSAQAVTLRYDDGSPALALQAWADASHVPTARGLVVVHRSKCFDGQPRSCTAAPGTALWLLEPASVLRAALAHELGHIFDYTRMTDRARDAFRWLIRDGRPWRATGGNSPHEKFAEAYGLCFRHRAIASRMQTGGYDYLPGPVQHRRVCRLIRLAAVGALV